MSRILYFDCFSGIAGDMTCAALLSLTGAEKDLRRALRGLQLRGYSLSVERASSSGMAGTRVTVKLSSRKGSARHLPGIVSLLRRSKLPAGTRERAIVGFERLPRGRGEGHRAAKEKEDLHQGGGGDGHLGNPFPRL